MSPSAKWSTFVYCCLLQQDISLSEALCGTSFYVNHLDGRVLEVLTLPGEVIKPDSWKCINEEGMPVHGRPYEKGNLYIRFSVKFPESLSSEEVQQLKQVLPPGPQSQAPMSEDEPEQVCPPSQAMVTMASFTACFAELYQPVLGWLSCRLRSVCLYRCLRYFVL